MENLKNKTIFIAGGNGFVGSALTSTLRESGFQVIILPRSTYQGDAQKLADEINGCYAIINLAGASINRRWTAKNKTEILNSRIQSTQTISKAIELCSIRPQRFISASAVGIYNFNDIHNEDSTGFSRDFLGQVCEQWENAAATVDSYTKLSIIRLGVVLGRHGGVLKKLLPLFRLGLGGRIGSGRQPFPFIHINDLCQSVVHILQQDKPSKVYNLVAPQLIDNRTFTKALAKAVHRPAIFVVPGFAMRLLYGQGATVVLDVQKVVAEALLKENFTFTYSNIQQALADF